jgi:LEA14-like dessication related protein
MLPKTLKRFKTWAMLSPALFLVLFETAFKDPEFIEMRNFRVTDVGIKQSEAKMDLVYYNPNRMKLEMKSGEVDIYINGRFAGKSMLDTIISIPGKDTFSIPAKMNVEMKNAFPNALAMVLNDEVEVKLDGYVKVGKGLIFINIPVRNTSKQKLNLFKQKSPAGDTAEH